MRWPWQRREHRQSGGGYSDQILAQIEAQAASRVTDSSATAAIEAASGALSRALAFADVEGPDWAKHVINPVWLAQVGRSLIREGESLSVILMRDGMPELIPAASWDFHHARAGAKDESEADWLCRATTYGPSSSTTRWVPREQIVLARWGTSPGIRYRGRSPSNWAALTARLQGEVERSLADEAGGPIAQIIPVPQDMDAEAQAGFKRDIPTARGKAMLPETTAAGWGEGQGAAPRKDWVANRLGPQPPESVVRLADAAFSRMLAACGASPAMFDDSDGTAKREALRQWHLGTVRPIARMLEYELSMQLGAQIRLRFDAYAMDLAGRAQAFQKLVAGGVAVNEALATSGLLAADA